jgi:hypothetical protein
MGGCIVQEIAINHPRRVLSLIINCSFAKFGRFGARITENIMNVYKSQTRSVRHMPSSIRRWPVWSTIHVHGSAAFVFQLW